jgi:hypothetical protein
MLSSEGGAMSGTRVGLGRTISIGIALALAVLLLAAKEATGAKYFVAQCGWHIAADANWADSTGGTKFRPDAYCATPAGTDPFDGAHMKSFTRDGQSTVSGTRYARWRWDAPPGTGISRVSGTWWHVLQDGMEQRLGVANWNGGFDVFAAASSTDVALRGFVAGFSPAQPAFEDRLLCARPESKWCSVSPGSWSAVRALTITLEDNYPPGSAVSGDVLAGGWLRGERQLHYYSSDLGAGLVRTEPLVDGRPTIHHAHPCNAISIGGEPRGTTMRPCPVDRVGYYTIYTTAFSDGPHTISHCATDFAGNGNCLPQTTFLIDNNPPAHPRSLTVAGGETWRRSNDFDPVWVNPEQGQASPIGGAFWRIQGPGDYDSGVKFAAARDLTTLQDLFVPRAGLFSLSVWLRDEAGNFAPSAAASVPLRFDDVPPAVAFDPESAGDALSRPIRVTVSDAHSGPASGEIHYRRLDSQQWSELPLKLQRGGPADTAYLVARLPSDLGPGTYVFRADAVDGAGNTASTSRRADGTEMTVRKVAGSPVAGLRRAQSASGRAKTRIFARLSSHGRRGTELTLPFKGVATLEGRLLDADGAGLPGRIVRVVSRPSRGALDRTRVHDVGTGPRGAFRLPLPAGTSRRIAIAFAGDEKLDQASRAPLTLRVRAGIDFRASPRVLRTGDRVRLLGRVRTRGAPLPRRGKLVAIQYFEAATKRWRPVLVTRSDHEGRFSAGYRFRYVSGSARIRLRAMVLPEERWPYAPGASRPVTVRVNG